MKKSTLFCLLLVFLISFFSFRNLLRPGYFPMHDDMQVIRLVEMDKCVKDGQIPCRWVPDLGYGYGYPLFNYYGPLSYYLMEIFHLSGFAFLDSIKIEMILTIILSGIGMFLLGKSLWGNLGGIVSAVFYVYAPYRAVDIYSRGAVGEFNALVFLPFIFWASIEYIRTLKTKYIIFLALPFSGLLLSHNITSFIFTPFVFSWCLLLSWHYKKWNALKGLIKSFFLAFCLAGFFIVPVLFEKKLVHVESMLSGYFNYLAHFVSLQQLFLSTHWGYGPSIFGPEDDFSFGVGIFHWVFGLVSLFLGFIFMKRNSFAFIVLIFLGLSSLFSTFMIHQRSVYFWNMIPVLAYLQFPWRFLALVIFFLSAMSGAVVYFAKKYSFPIATTMIVLVIMINVNYFTPERWLDITDKDKMTGKLWEKQVTASIFDYLPIFAVAPPADAAPYLPWSIEGEIKVDDYNKGTNWQKGKLEVLTDKASVRLPLFYFPNFVLKVDGEIAEINYNNELGLVTFNIDRGVHAFDVKLEDTFVRRVGNLLTIGGLLYLLFWLLYRRKENENLEK